MMTQAVNSSQYYVFFVDSSDELLKDGFVKGINEKDEIEYVPCSEKKNCIRFNSLAECKEYIAKLKSVLTMPNIRLRPFRAQTFN